MEQPYTAPVEQPTSAPLGCLEQHKTQPKQQPQQAGRAQGYAQGQEPHASHSLQITRSQTP